MGCQLLLFQAKKTLGQKSLPSMMSKLSFEVLRFCFGWKEETKDFLLTFHLFVWLRQESYLIQYQKASLGGDGCLLNSGL